MCVSAVRPEVMSLVNEPVDPRVEIVAYLRAHPSAADSFDGILDWWLPTQRYETGKAAIQRALDDLSRQGVIEEFRLANGVILYRLATRSVTVP